MERKRKPTETRGKYEIRPTSGGGWAIYWTGLDGELKRKRIASDEVLARRCIEEIKRIGRLSASIERQVRYRAVIVDGTQDRIKGLEALGVEIPVTPNTPVSRTECEKSLRQVYPAEEVKRFLKGEEVSLLGITEFFEQHTRQAQAIYRHFGGISRFMEGIYKGLYNALAKQDKSGKVDIERLREEYVRRREEGEIICPTLLLASPHRRDRNLVFALDSLMRKHPDYIDLHSRVEAVARLLDIPVQEVGISSGIRKTSAVFTENLIEVMFLLSFLIGNPFGRFEEYKKAEKELTFHYGSEKELAIADGRIGNKAIEIKHGVGKFNHKRLESFLSRYAKGESFWLEESDLDLPSEPMEGCFAVFLMPQRAYAEHIQRIMAAGIDILGYEDCRRILEQEVNVLRQRYTSNIAEIRPRIHNPNYLVQLLEELTFRPGELSRPANHERRKWTKEVLFNFTERFRAIRRNYNGA